MKIYTGTGDRGTTGLFSGERVSKNHDRLKAYGDLDELSSFLGLLVAKLPGEDKEAHAQLQTIQGDLLTMGAWLATTPDSQSACVLADVTDGPRRCLEQCVDTMQERLTPLTQFILPGGHETAGLAHVARTVCRRAERNVVALYHAMGEEERTPQLEEFMVYLNRLSDYLFVLARSCNSIYGEGDVAWNP